MRPRYEKYRNTHIYSGEVEYQIIVKSNKKQEKKMVCVCVLPERGGGGGVKDK